MVIFGKIMPRMPEKWIDPLQDEKGPVKVHHVDADAGAGTSHFLDDFFAGTFFVGLPFRALSASIRVGTPYFLE